jgi:hypothetical protein
MIPGMRGLFRALLLLLLATALPARAQDMPFAAPPPPADGLLDESRVLAREPERKQAITAALAGLEAKHGFRMYFALYDSLYGRSVADRARDLQQAWLGDRPGMVLVLETDSRTFKLGRPPPRQKEIGSGQAVEVLGPADLSSLDLSEVVRGLEGSLMTARDAAEFAERLGTGFAAGISTVFEERATRPEGSASRSRMIALAIGLLAATGLLALLVVAGLKRAEARSLERYVFPKVSVGTRLGAPYGGGKISSRGFGRRTGD